MDNTVLARREILRIAIDMSQSDDLSDNDTKMMETLVIYDDEDTD